MLEISIRKHLGEFELDVQLTASDDQIVVLFGPSGAGKSMTLASVAGFMIPDSGRIVAGKQVLFDSQSAINLPPQKRHIGLVKQELALFPHLTVEQNIEYGLFRSPARTRRERATNLLQLMKLDGMASRYPSQLSGGQQQRVALARALAPSPELLLLDEPFSALDAPTRMQLRDELLSLQRTLKIPIVFVTHDLGEAYFLADRLAVIDGGRILQLDAPGEILQHPRSLPVARAIGVKNILSGTVETNDDGGCRVRVGKTLLDAPSCGGEDGSPVHVCMRAERIMLVHPNQVSGLRDNELFGEIIREMSDGANTTLYFRGNTRMVTDGSQDYDLQIELPVYIYERLNLAHRRTWTVSLKKNAVHLIR